ncbi:MAG TPA: MBOAT family protein [Verrucomicrobiae bacterium]|nr:MBOAT family protein [Verrucomicrobiae bacterium]
MTSVNTEITDNNGSRILHQGVWPAILLLVAAVAWKPALPAWGFMWAMVAALVAGMIGLTGWRPRPGGERAALGFCRMILGAVMFWGVARWAPGEIARGWMGMIGLVLMLHFGLVHWLMAMCGFEPIMREPLRARSLSEFWSGRWNRVFPEMMRPLVFEPIAKRRGAALATMAAFGVSGLLHELVISLPAGAGYGLPTFYFLVQGLGVCVERRVAFARGWLWMLAVTAGPVFWLFHPPFVERVIIPFMEAVRAS